MGVLDRFSLAGKAAVVTGAGRGLGRGVARGLAEAGCDLALLARTGAEIEAAAEEARALGRRAVAIVTDVREGAQVEAAAERAVSALGRIDVLVNNAGGAYPGPLLDLPEARWDEGVRANLRPVFLCCRAFGRLLRAQGSGAIINMGSLAGQAPAPELSPYAASKAAIEALTRALAQELGPFGVRVNAVAPGKMLASHTSTGALWATEEARAAAARDVALGRLGTPEDVAALVVFLASDAAAYLTGQTLTLDGGWGALRLAPPAGPRVEEAPPEAVVQVHLTGEGGASFHLLLGGEAGRRVEGVTAEAGATLSMAAADWRAIREGRLDRMQAFMEGRMQIEGDVSLLARYEAEIDRLG